MKGYTFRAIPAPPVSYSDGSRRAWYGKVRRKGWEKGYWVTVKSDYGPISYTTPEAAKAAALLWAQQNETKGA